MSFQKIAQNVAQPIVLAKLLHNQIKAKVAQKVSDFQKN
jgi:hypothetical protein